MLNSLQTKKSPSEQKWGEFLNSGGMQAMVKNMFRDEAAKGRFFQEVLAYVNKNQNEFQYCDKMSVIAAFLQSASLQLTTTLGECWIVPYLNKAQWQISARGLIQLALRSGFYRSIDAFLIHSDEIVEINPYEGIFKFQHNPKSAAPIAGVYSYLELINGFIHRLWMTKEELLEHAAKYSQSYRTSLEKGNKKSLWETNFEGMALKTGLKRLLMQWGLKSKEMASAAQADQAILSVDTNSVEYVDNPKIEEPVEAPEQPVPAKTEEIAETPKNDIAKSVFGHANGKGSAKSFKKSQPQQFEAFLEVKKMKTDALSPKSPQIRKVKVTRAPKNMSTQKKHRVGTKAALNEILKKN